MTTSWKSAKNLGRHRGCHPKGFEHSELEGSKAGRSAFYIYKMAKCISASLYPSKDVPAMPTIPFEQSEHVPNEPLDLGVRQLIEIGILVQDCRRPSTMKEMVCLRMKLGRTIAFVVGMIGSNQRRSTILVD